MENKKSDRESQSKQPTAFSVLMRFRGTNRNRFSPTNGREIQSGASSRAKHGGAYFSAVRGSIKDPIAVPGRDEVQEC